MDADAQSEFGDDAVGEGELAAEVAHDVAHGQGHLGDALGLAVSLVGRLTISVDSRVELAE